MAAGEAIGCFGLTEPDAGSDPGAMRTRARRDGADWILHGAEDVDHQRLGRRRRGRLGAAPTRAIRGFLVPKGTAGLHRRRTSTSKLSLRASITSELLLDDVRLPADARAARRSDSLRGPLSCLNEARYGIVWGAVGAGARLLRGRARLRQGADRVRQADRRLPDHAAEARRDGARGQPGDAARRCTSAG